MMRFSPTDSPKTLSFWQRKDIAEIRRVPNSSRSWHHMFRLQPWWLPTKFSGL